MLLVIICFLKKLLHINLAPHRKAVYNRTLQTENNPLSIKILDLHFSLSKVVFHKVQFLDIFCSLFFNDLPLFIKEAYLDLYADDATVHVSEKQQKRC